MASAGPAKLVWPGAILAGLALLGIVALAWPDSTTRIVRLPYGESLPKTPRQPVREAEAARVSEPAQARRRTTGAAPVQTAPAEEAGRVLAAVERERASVGGPAPLPSLLELQPGYVPDSPEQLGAEPLPGAVLTPSPPPVAG